MSDDNALQDEILGPETETKQAKKESAKVWSVPKMAVDPNNVIRFSTDDNSISSISDKNLSKAQLDEKQQISKQEIFDKAQDDGYQIGFQKGLEYARKETDRLHQEIKNIIQCLNKPLEHVNDEVINQLERLAVTLAQQLVRRELKTNSDEIIGVIRDSIKILTANPTQIDITIHPEDAVLIKEALSIEESDKDLNWNIIDDPLISRGGCKIKAGNSVIDASLENRLASLAASVFSSERKLDDSHNQSTEKPAKDLNPEKGSNIIQE